MAPEVTIFICIYQYDLGYNPILFIRNKHVIIIHKYLQPLQDEWSRADVLLQM